MSHAEPRAGVEYRQHDRPHRAGFIGIDVGWLHAHADSESENDSITGAFAMPRAGWEHVPLQSAAEVVVGYGHSAVGAVPPEASGRLFGGTFGLGLIVR